MKASFSCEDQGSLFKVSLQPGPLNAFKVTVFNGRNSGVAPGSAEPRGPRGAPVLQNSPWLKF